MAEKIYTVILKVDLNCRSCYKKISKTICKLQAREKIQTVAFDEKNGTVTISGPFDPKKLCKKLCCKACKVIKDIQIKENKEKEKQKDTKPAEPAKPKEDKPKDTKPAESAKPKETKAAEPAKPKEDKPKETKPTEPSKPKEDKPKETKPKDTKPAEQSKPKENEPEKPKPKPQTEPVQSESGCQPIWPGPTCNCGCKPWFDGYYGACPWCGRGYGWSPVVVPQPVVVCGAPPACGGYKTCEFFYEEDPQSSCGIM